METKLCKHCGATITKKPTHSRRVWQERVKYCSRSCLRKDTVPGFTGKRHTEETKAINAEAHRGSKSPTWKGGVDKENRSQRKLFLQRARRAVFERDSYECVFCGSTEYLTVDHIKSFAEHPELRFDMKNCRTLCMKCHYKESFGRDLQDGTVWGVNKRHANITHTG